MAATKPPAPLPAPPPAPNLAELTGAVSLTAVRVVRSSSRLIGIRREDQGVALQLLHSVRVGGMKSPDLEGIRTLASIECKLVAPGEPARDLAIVDCDVVLEYALQDAGLLHRLTDADFQAFSQTSGLYNAWPYLREYCQSTSARMGLPVQMVLPTLPPQQRGAGPGAAGTRSTKAGRQQEP